MSRRSSLGFIHSPNKKVGGGRLSMGGRRSIGVMGPPATPVSGGGPIVGTNTPTSAFLDVPENNDEEERRQRQLSRLQQLQSSRQLNSPSTDSAGEGSDRRRSIASLEPKLTGQQLSIHYAKCIQLSAENKINIKNAFNLQLIDYMTDMLRQKDSDMNNFQVASCTLDASTKIYAYRVDCIHTDTMRMAGGLGRTQQEAGQGEGSQEGTQEGGQAGKIKRKRTKKASTIESNPSALTLSSLDLEFMVNPLFKKIASQFDEGRAGLFQNSLLLRDDTYEQLLDPEAVLDTVPDKNRPNDTSTVTILPPPDLSQKEICPSFSSFHFNSWKVGDEDSFMEPPPQDDKDDDKQAEHAFDMNAIPEPLDDDLMFADDNAGGMDDACGGDDDDDTVGATLGDGGGNNTCLTVGWGGQHATSSMRPQPAAMETTHLKEHLATMQLEYSYFDQRIMSAWAGPGHWKLKPAARDKASMVGEGESGKKRKKDAFELHYRLKAEERDSIDKQFEVCKRLTKLSQKTIKNWSEDNTTLPVDLHFDPTDFAKLYGRSEVIVRRQNDNVVVETEDGDCAEDTGAHDYDDHADDAGAGECSTSGAGYDMTMFSQTMMPGSQLPQETGADFLGDNLVAAPNKVAKINIGYARTAKRMDMKKLKGTLWGMLTSPASQDKENDRNSANVNPAVAEDKSVMPGGRRVQFSQMYRSLPQRLNSRMAENLSLPLAFIALLHLCNENNLQLSQTGNMEDFTILQG